MAGNVEGRSDFSHTRPGGLGVQADGVNVGERPCVNYLSNVGIRWNGTDNPGAGRVDLQPIVDGVVELARFSLDATSATSSVLVILPTAPAFDGVIPLLMWIRCTALAGVVSHPSLSLGSNATAYDNAIPQTAMSFSAAGEVRWEGVASGIAIPFVSAGSELRFNRSIQAVATTYSLDVAVFGHAIAP